jgi:hypothetical protein
MTAPTQPRPVNHTDTRYLEPASGVETIGTRCVMASYWRTGGHVHITLRHGVYGCHCPLECRVGGIKEWKP